MNAVIGFLILPTSPDVCSTLVGNVGKAIGNGSSGERAFASALTWWWTKWHFKPYDDDPNPPEPLDDLLHGAYKIAEPTKHVTRNHI